MRAILKARLQSGFLLGGALLVASFFAPPWVALVILVALTALGLWEFYSLLDAARIPNFRCLGTLVGVGMMAATFGAWRWGAPAWRGDVDLLVVFLAFFAVFARQFSQKHSARPLETLAATLLGLLYIAFLLTFLARILLAWGGLEGRWLLLYMIVVVKFTDIGAFFVGSWIGRHKLIPRISPAKSWEGVIGGVLIATAVSVGTYCACGGRLGPVRLHLHDALLLALILSVSGILGDLAESLLKRAAGVKDSGTMIAGMGGLLDVVDSLLPAAPMLYFYAHYFLQATAAP